MRVFAAIVFGFFSGLLICSIVGLAAGSGGSSGTGVVAFLGGWVITTWLLARDARTVGKVMTRGFLVGAAEWLCVIPAGIIAGGRAAASTAAAAPSDASKAGAVIGGGLVSVLTGGIAFAAAIFCLVCFVVAYFMTREMKAERVG
jgi:hypothetical protein